MPEKLPDYLTQGEPARLFPVLSTTSKEGRTTSILLACLSKIEEFGASLLGTVGQRVGKRSRIETYTEVAFEKPAGTCNDRPDGLVVLKVGSREWRALVEAKVGKTLLDAEQIERYRGLAKDNGIDCVISISNQFATSPVSHPLDAVRKSRSRIPVYHWSWKYILTEADLLINQNNVEDRDQFILLSELRRFLQHESVGVRGFSRMPKEWSDLNRLIFSGGVVPAKSKDASSVLAAWHQETRDLSLILSRLTETGVTEKLPRKHMNQPAQRQKDELEELRQAHRLGCVLDVPDAAAPVEVVADLMRRCIDVGMKLRAPEDRKTTKARVNWLLRQIKTEDVTDLYVRLLWPGSSGYTQVLVSELRENTERASKGKEHLTARGFFVFRSHSMAARFTQRANFIADLEKTVPEFYGTVGSNLRAWKRSAPKIRPEKTAPEEPGDVLGAEDEGRAVFALDQ